MARPSQETLRRFLLGDLRRLIQLRCGGIVVPDDDVGREYVEELLTVISLGKKADERMQFEIEQVAPWMQATDAKQMVERIGSLGRSLRMIDRKRLSQRLRLTNAEREARKIWQLPPCDLSKAQLIEQRKAKDRTRKRKARARKPRAAYLANSLSQQRPWQAEGVGRATWYRRQAEVETSVSADQSKRETGVSPIKKDMHRTHPSHRPNVLNHRGAARGVPVVAPCHTPSAEELEIPEFLKRRKATNA